MSKLNELLAPQSGNLFDEGGFAVHCPMVLIALSRLGASDAQLLHYFETWRNENPTLAKDRSAVHRDSPINTTNWQQSLNRVQHFSDLQRFFQSWIEQTSPQFVMEKVLSQIPPAPASVAFHGLIRTSYGVEAKHTGEIAAGLAAMVVHNFHFDLGKPADRPTVKTVSQGLAHMQACMPGFNTDKINITARIREVVVDGRFAQSLPELPGNHIEDMARTAITLYVQQPNLTTLHMVTAVNAARTVFADLPDVVLDSYLGAIWSAYCAAYVSTGSQRFAKVDEPQDLFSWETLFVSACGSDRDHMIKMIHTCYQEQQRVDSVELKTLYLKGANIIFAS